VEVTRVAATDGEGEIAAVTVYDPCHWSDGFESAVAFIDKNGALTVKPAGFPGANHRASALVAADRDWVLVSAVFQNLGVSAKWNSEDAFPDVPEKVARSFDSNSRTGVLVTRFDENGTKKGVSVHLFAGQLWIDDAYSDAPGVLSVVGADGGARFRASQPVP
jgi:hypothetical protein